MNIAIDVQPLINYRSANRGVGLLTKDMLSNMFSIDKTNKYFLFNMYDDTRNDDIDLMKMFDYPENVSESYFCMGYDFWTFRNKDYDVVAGKTIKKFIKENDIDVFIHFTSLQTDIVYNPVWYEDVYLISYCYDLIPYLFPENYIQNDKIRKKLDDNLLFLAKSDKIIAISECTKDDFCKFTGFNSDNVEVLYPGTDIKVAEANENFPNILSKFGINRKFALTVTGFDWRKNNENLITAFSKMPKSLISEYQLVIVGVFGAKGTTLMQSLIDRYGLTNDVIITGGVTDEELACFYSSADCFTFVSKYEGFGLPIIEAMTNGIPVLTSSNSACAEIAGEGAVLCDPFNVEDIADKLQYILTADCNDMIKNGHQRASEFSYSTSANKLIEIVNTIQLKTKKEKLRIAYFSSVPPILSGISDFTIDILSDIYTDYDVDIFIDDGYIPDENILGNIKTYNYREFEKTASRYDLYFFQIGNNKYHLYEYEYIRKFGGLVEFHDLDLYANLKLLVIEPDSANFNKLKEYLLDDVDEEMADEMIYRVFARTFKQPRPDGMVGFLANYADEVITHSQCTKEVLEKKNIHGNVVELYKTIYNEMDYSEVRKSLGISEDKIIIICSGIINRAKRIIQILNAFTSISNDNVELYIVGMIDDEVLEKEIKKFVNTSENIKTLSNVTTAEMNMYTVASDIVLCCRYPDFMQTSANLISAARYGKCIVTSRVGSFDEIPDNCVVKIDSPNEIEEDVEVEQLKLAIKNLVENTNVRTELAKNMKEYADSTFGQEIIKSQYDEIINKAERSLYSEQYLNNLKKDFNSYTPNKELLSYFEKTLEFLRK